MLALITSDCVQIRYYDNLLKGVAAGHCSMEDVDAAVGNTLTGRMELGR